MTRTSVIAMLAFVALPLAGFAQQPAPTNAIGMEFVRIQPGTMQVGVYQPECPDPSAPLARGGGAGAARGGDQGRGADAGRGGGRAAAPQDPRTQWGDADYKACQELARRDSTAGFSVTIRRAFDIGKYEVTQAQWKRVMGSNPSTFQGDKVTDDADRHPVESVTWQQAQAFIAKLNQLEKTHAYRLPTEFEWEYAGRAGGQGQTPWPQIRESAVMSNPGRGGGSGPSPAPQTTSVVGTMKPNAWGLYDMLGNVWEWVQDFYNVKMFPDPTPPKSGAEHVLKGCGFGAADVGNCIYATHAAGPADGYDVGFRVLRDIQ
jgi:formylglycine-generating enzyme required for sulfatase activity